MQDGCDDDSADFLLDCAGQTSLCPSFFKHSHAVKLCTVASTKLGKYSSTASVLGITAALADTKGQILKLCSSEIVVCVEK